MRIFNNLTLTHDGIMEKDIEKIIARLRAKGVKLTPQRLGIIEFLTKTYEHPTAEEIHTAIAKKYSTMSLATVYTTLELLKELGEITELSIRRRGQACFDTICRMHHHLLCRQCDKVIDVELNCPEDCPIVRKVKIGGCIVDEIQAYLYGLCPECARKEDKKKNNS